MSVSRATTDSAGTRRVPALVVSGFLGSGKTTLVRHLLADAQRRGERVAVISNEFGALGIDAALLGSGREAYVELEGGCVCCQLSDELLDTLVMLRAEVDPDKIVVETSGVALPYDTQLNFYRAPVGDWIGDDVAVVVVNAAQLAAGRDLEGTFADQVSSADLLILNQLDQIAADAVEGAVARLRALEPEAPIIRAVHAEVDPRLLFPPDPEGVRAARRGAAAPRPHTHEDFEAREWEVPAGIGVAALRDALVERAALRAKGFVETDEGVRLVQAVGSRVELSEPDAAPDPALLGRVVVIARADGPARG